MRDQPTELRETFFTDVGRIIEKLREHVSPELTDNLDEFESHIRERDYEAAGKKIYEILEIDNFWFSPAHLRQTRKSMTVKRFHQEFDRRLARNGRFGEAVKDLTITMFNNGGYEWAAKLAAEIN